MSLEEKISDYLFDNLDYIYCQNCRYNNEEDDLYHFCENCHRKAMNWEISKSECDCLARKILKIINESD